MLHDVAGWGIGLHDVAGLETKSMPGVSIKIWSAAAHTKKKDCERTRLGYKRRIETSSGTQSRNIKMEYD